MSNISGYSKDDDNDGDDETNVYNDVIRRVFGSKDENSNRKEVSKTKTYLTLNKNKQVEDAYNMFNKQRYDEYVLDDEEEIARIEATKKVNMRHLERLQSITKTNFSC